MRRNARVFLSCKTMNALFAKHSGFLAQSCSLRSVTLTPTYRRSLISPLQGIINALLNGQLVPQTPLKFT